uniref:Transmembrane protein 222 n=1 Tax=Panagrellus redivivus TaxID=6233 RepID=A0A7E4VAW1_PANRE
MLHDLYGLLLLRNRSRKMRSSCSPSNANDCPIAKTDEDAQLSPAPLRLVSAETRFREAHAIQPALMTTSESDPFSLDMTIDAKNHLFPFCVVWTPLPLLSWLFPFIGHIGIASSRGIIRDFAGPYYVAENDMGFGWPSMYWRLDLTKVNGGPEGYDRAVREASDEYKQHNHNLFCDNCHSHVALALNNMAYNGKTNWNMVSVAIYMLINGRFVGVSGFLKQYLPVIVIIAVILSCVFILPRVGHL